MRQDRLLVGTVYGFACRSEGRWGEAFDQHLDLVVCILRVQVANGVGCQSGQARGRFAKWWPSAASSVGNVA